MWSAELRCCFIRDNFAAGKRAVIFPNTNVKNQSFLAVAPKDMLKLVTQYKPEVVDTVVSKCHSDDGTLTGWRKRADPHKGSNSVVAALAAYDRHAIHETPDRLNRKVNRKKFSAAFHLACLKALE
ncbi:hypothetical protein SAMN05216344_101288 [Polaromonas sp. OV174]|uniref:DUF6471 domain-containing protein n=1 Tax=Polaromonas sp. OV174 TaxID=1855300 RepID=UPI0008E5968F|nr:DUF6471 domain-containing protein [Polaromonas sp. OV174]SFB69457.1 hypothetical protein SAMN05216344_101288 [Polaromonas sp. OV174]